MNKMGLGVFFNKIGLLGRKGNGKLIVVDQGRPLNFQILCL